MKWLDRLVHKKPKVQDPELAQRLREAEQAMAEQAANIDRAAKEQKKSVETVETQAEAASKSSKQIERAITGVLM